MLLAKFFHSRSRHTRPRAVKFKIKFSGIKKADKAAGNFVGKNGGNLIKFRRFDAILELKRALSDFSAEKEKSRNR